MQAVTRRNGQTRKIWAPSVRTRFISQAAGGWRRLLCILFQKAHWGCSAERGLRRATDSLALLFLTVPGQGSVSKFSAPRDDCREASLPGCLLPPHRQTPRGSRRTVGLLLKMPVAFRGETRSACVDGKMAFTGLGRTNTSLMHCLRPLGEAWPVLGGGDWNRQGCLVWNVLCAANLPHGSFCTVLRVSLWWDCS